MDSSFRHDGSLTAISIPPGWNAFARDYDARFGAFAMSVNHRTTWGESLRYQAILDRLPPGRSGTPFPVFGS